MKHRICFALKNRRVEKVLHFMDYLSSEVFELAQILATEEERGVSWCTHIVRRNLVPPRHGELLSLFSFELQRLLRA